MRWATSSRRRGAVDGAGMKSDWRNAETAGEKQWPTKGGAWTSSAMYKCTECTGNKWHPCLCIIEEGTLSQVQLCHAGEGKFVLTRQVDQI